MWKSLPKNYLRQSVCNELLAISIAGEDSCPPIYVSAEIIEANHILKNQKVTKLASFLNSDYANNSEISGLPLQRNFNGLVKIQALLGWKRLRLPTLILFAGASLIQACRAN
jgi:hypothetical protein